VTWVVKRYIPLAAGATVWDPDPAVTQPGATAVDGAGDPIPLTTVRGGQVWGDVQVVDAAGVVQPPGAFTVTLGFVKRTTREIVAATGAIPRSQVSWNKGALSTNQAPGIEQVQGSMESPSTVVLVVTDGADPPAAPLRLAVSVWEPPR